MQSINMQNANTPTVLEVIPADEIVPSWTASKHVTKYEGSNVSFPLFIDGIMFTKFVPGFEGLYVTNVSGDLAGVERTVVLEGTSKGNFTQTYKAAIHRPLVGLYNLSHRGLALQISRNGLIFYSGFKKPTFDASTVFPVEYKGKKWIAWMPGNLHLKAAIASDGSVLTMESAIATEPGLRAGHYVYKDERLCDVNATNYYINKEKSLPIPKRELIAYAKLKCKALGITP